jgi:excisionase family DNA binding protein
MNNLTTQQTAAALSVTPQRVRQLIKAGRIKAVRFGRDWQIDAESLKGYVKRNPGRPWPKDAKPGKK